MRKRIATKKMAMASVGIPSYKKVFIGLFALLFTAKQAEVAGAKVPVSCPLFVHPPLKHQDATRWIEWVEKTETGCELFREPDTRQVNLVDADLSRIPAFVDMGLESPFEYEHTRTEFALLADEGFKTDMSGRSYVLHQRGPNDVKGPYQYRGEYLSKRLGCSLKIGFLLGDACRALDLTAGAVNALILDINRRKAPVMATVRNLRTLAKQMDITCAVKDTDAMNYLHSCPIESDTDDNMNDDQELLSWADDVLSDAEANRIEYQEALQDSEPAEAVFSAHPVGDFSSQLSFEVFAKIKTADLPMLGKLASNLFPQKVGNEWTKPKAFFLTPLQKSHFWGVWKDREKELISQIVEDQVDSARFRRVLSRIESCAWKDLKTARNWIEEQRAVWVGQGLYLLRRQLRKRESQLKREWAKKMRARKVKK